MKQNERTGDYKRAFKEAEMFCKLTDLCMENSKDGFYFDCIYPLIVNSALSCELYMKGICLKRNGYFTAGHYLKEQFCHLPNDAQEAIKRKHREVMNDFSFEEALELNSKAFEDWRYTFEESDKKGACTDLFALITMMHALQEYVDALES